MAVLALKARHSDSLLQQALITCLRQYEGFEWEPRTLKLGDAMMVSRSVRVWVCGLYCDSTVHCV
jgi:hypothetical protein